MVRQNAALALVRFGDASGHAIILSMLEPYPLGAPRNGVLRERLHTGDVINPGTLLGRIESGGEKLEMRSPVPGTLARWLAVDGASVSTGQVVARIFPSPEMAWEALRALYLIGAAQDLSVVEGYARGVEGMPESVRQQAVYAARAIRARSTSGP